MPQIPHLLRHTRHHTTESVVQILKLISGPYTDIAEIPDHIIQSCLIHFLHGKIIHGRCDRIDRSNHVISRDPQSAGQYKHKVAQQNDHQSDGIYLGIINHLRIVNISTGISHAFTGRIIYGIVGRLQMSVLILALYNRNLFSGQKLFFVL